MDAYDYLKPRPHLVIGTPKPWQNLSKRAHARYARKAAEQKRAVETKTVQENKAVEIKTTPDGRAVDIKTTQEHKAATPEPWHDGAASKADGTPSSSPPQDDRASSHSDSRAKDASPSVVTFSPDGSTGNQDSDAARDAAPTPSESNTTLSDADVAKDNVALPDGPSPENSSKPKDKTRQLKAKLVPLRDRNIRGLEGADWGYELGKAYKEHDHELFTGDIFEAPPRAEVDEVDGYTAGGYEVDEDEADYEEIDDEDVEDDEACFVVDGSASSQVRDAPTGTTSVEAQKDASPSPGDPQTVQGTCEWCGHWPCLGGEYCEFRHLEGQQSLMACQFYHFKPKGCAHGKNCYYFHYTGTQHDCVRVDHHHYVFAQPTRTISVEKNGKVESRQVDNRVDELFTNLSGLGLVTCPSWKESGICPEHYSGPVRIGKDQTDWVQPTAQSISDYINHKHDQSKDDIAEGTHVSDLPCTYACPFDHRFVPANGMLYRFGFGPASIFSSPEVDYSRLHFDLELIKDDELDPVGLIPASLDFNSAQKYVDSYVIDLERKRYPEYRKKLDSSLGEMYPAKKAKVEYLMLLQKAKKQQKQELDVLMQQKKQAVFAAQKKRKMEMEKKKEQMPPSVAGKKRKCDEVSDPEPGTASVKKARPDEISSPATVLPKKAPLAIPAKAVPAAASATKTPSPPVAPTPSASRKRKQSDDDEQQSTEPTQNKKAQCDDSAGATLQSLFLRRQFQRPSKISTTPTSTATKKRGRQDDEPSAPAAALPSPKKRKRGDEDDGVHAEDESSLNKKKKLRVSTSSNESSDSAAASRSPSPVFSGGNSPASSAAAAPSPPSVGPSPREMIPPKASPAAIAPNVGALKGGSSPLPATTHIDAAKGISSTLPAISNFPPMPECPPGIVRMSMNEYREKTAIFAKMKREKAPIDERRRVLDDIIQSIKSRGVDHPDPVKRASIYAQFGGCGPEWDPC